ncbi:MAG: hypothetical protein WCJ71_04325, partial [Candidatus Omnitrophota bacterium]
QELERRLNRPGSPLYDPTRDPDSPYYGWERTSSVLRAEAGPAVDYSKVASTGDKTEAIVAPELMTPEEAEKQGISREAQKEAILRAFKEGRPVRRAAASGIIPSAEFEAEFYTLSNDRKTWERSEDERLRLENFRKVPEELRAKRLLEGLEAAKQELTEDKKMLKRNEAYRNAGYELIGGFWVHPMLSYAGIRGLSENTKSVLRSLRIRVITSGNGWNGAAGAVVGIRLGSDGPYIENDTMYIRDKLGTIDEHVILHEAGHHAWQKILSEEQRKEWATRERATKHGQDIASGKQTGNGWYSPELAPEEDFAEAFADADGDAGKLGFRSKTDEISDAGAENRVTNASDERPDIPKIADGTERLERLRDRVAELIKEGKTRKGVTDIHRYVASALLQSGEFLTDEGVAQLQADLASLTPPDELSVAIAYGELVREADGVEVLGMPSKTAAKTLRSEVREAVSPANENITDDEQIAEALSRLDPKDLSGIDAEVAAGAVKSFRLAMGGQVKVVFQPDRTLENPRPRRVMLSDGEGEIILLRSQDLMDMVHQRYVGSEMNIHESIKENDIPVSKQTEVAAINQELKLFLATLTRSRFLAMVRSISGDNSVQWEDLGKDIYLDAYMAGSNKHVFKVTLRKVSGDPISFAIATKIGRTDASIAQTEINEMEILNDRPEQVTPRFGEARNTKGRRWYMEEFIDGKTVRTLEKEGGVTRDVRRGVISALLSVSMGLNGKMPRDMHSNNFVVRQSDGRVIMVDIGVNRFNVLDKTDNEIQRETQNHHRIASLAVILAQYGYLEGSPEQNNFIFDAIMNDKNLPQGEGKKWVEGVYQNLRGIDVAEIAEFLHNRKWLNHFRSVFEARGLGEYPAEKESMNALMPVAEMLQKSIAGYAEAKGMKAGQPSISLVAPAETAKRRSEARAIKSFYDAALNAMTPESLGTLGINPANEKKYTIKEVDVVNTGKTLGIVLSTVLEGTLEGDELEVALNRDVQYSHETQWKDVKITADVELINGLPLVTNLVIPEFLEERGFRAKDVKDVLRKQLAAINESVDAEEKRLGASALAKLNELLSGGEFERKIKAQDAFKGEAVRVNGQASAQGITATIDVGSEARVNLAATLWPGSVQTALRQIRVDLTGQLSLNQDFERKAARIFLGILVESGVSIEHFGSVLGHPDREQQTELLRNVLQAAAPTGMTIEPQ